MEAATFFVWPLYPSKIAFRHAICLSATTGEVSTGGLFAFLMADWRLFVYAIWLWYSLYLYIYIYLIKKNIFLYNKTIIILSYIISFSYFSLVYIIIKYLYYIILIYYITFIIYFNIVSYIKLYHTILYYIMLLYYIILYYIILYYYFICYFIFKII